MVQKGRNANNIPAAIVLNAIPYGFTFAAHSRLFLERKVHIERLLDILMLTIMYHLR
jgi:hypothetical protein